MEAIPTLVTPNRLSSSTLKVAVSWDSAYGGRRQVYRNINHTRSGTSINVFSFFTSIARLEEGKLGRPALRAYEVLLLSV